LTCSFFPHFPHTKWANKTTQGAQQQELEGKKKNKKKKKKKKKQP